ncbi:MAG: glycosyl transferase [Thermocladium sp. ECH_B]|nr:MAG: glycosyl transferase [Thermocladium sp. ECH_B]
MYLFDIAVTLIAVHFLVPITYYAVVRGWLRKPWPQVTGIDPPTVSVMIPTYNEASVIGKRLENIAKQGYPLDKLEVIVIDSSNDDTADIATKWAEKLGLNLKLIRERERRGKAMALNAGLRQASGDIIVLADADAFWGGGALPNAVTWFSNQAIGAVSCVKKPISGGEEEETYRDLYNLLRIGESKKYSTPIFHGELAAFRRSLLDKLGGFPTNLGADDSHTATRIVGLGFRSIIPDNVTCSEIVPNEDFINWKIRRAQHLIQHFIAAIRLRYPREFLPILSAEFYLHVINPWMLALGIALLVASHGLPAIAILAIGVAAIAWGPYRTWMLQQVYLLAASLRNTYTKELIWSKQEKHGVETSGYS